MDVRWLAADGPYKPILKHGIRPVSANILHHISILPKVVTLNFQMTYSPHLFPQSDRHKSCHYIDRHYHFLLGPQICPPIAESSATLFQ
jgi:hypothetical protein